MRIILLCHIFKDKFTAGNVVDCYTLGSGTGINLIAAFSSYVTPNVNVYLALRLL